MASKRELIEAHKYSRRRLVSAFVSGSPQGKEVESLSRARPVVAGVVLTALMVAGVALSGLLRPGLPAGWDEQGVVITQDGGERFLALDGTLYPVINTTSARLLLPADSGYRVEVVPDDAVAEAPRGATIGIVGAPDDLPDPAELRQTGWTACLAPDGRSFLFLDDVADVSDDASSAVVVAHDGAHWLVTGGLRYEIPPEQHAGVLRVLALDTVPTVTAPGTFLDLYTPGNRSGGRSRRSLGWVRHCRRRWAPLEVRRPSASSFATSTSAVRRRSSPAVVRRRSASSPRPSTPRRPPMGWVPLSR